MQLNRSEYYDELLVQVIPTLPAFIYLKTGYFIYLAFACVGVLCFLIMSNAYKRVVVKYAWMRQIFISVSILLTLSSVLTLAVDMRGVGIAVWVGGALVMPVYIIVRKKVAE